MKFLEDWIITHYASIWYIGYPAFFFLFTLLENCWPLRDYEAPIGKRFLTNLSLFVLNAGILKLLLPILPIAAALLYQNESTALLNQTGLGPVAKLLVAILILDCIAYLTHRAYHDSQFLWRFHSAHHSDIDFDASTGLRFHPFETLFTTAINFIAIIFLGIPVLAILVLDCIHIFTTYYTHTNIRFPLRLDRYIRILLVTPDMHRTHHSTLLFENKHNYGTFLSFWDHLFGTYLAAPQNDRKTMQLGLPIKDLKNLMLFRLLVLPFKSQRS